jgi:hypothetical protein
MKSLYPRCGALDVHKETVVACARAQEWTRVSRDVATFATTTAGLLALAEPVPGRADPTLQNDLPHRIEDTHLALPLMHVDPDVFHGWPPSVVLGPRLPPAVVDQPLHPLYLPSNSHQYSHRGAPEKAAVSGGAEVVELPSESSGGARSRTADLGIMRIRLTN